MHTACHVCLESDVSEVPLDIPQGTQCVGWHEILKDVSLILTCVGFVRCVAVSGFRGPRTVCVYVMDQSPLSCVGNRPY